MVLISFITVFMIWTKFFLTTFHHFLVTWFSWFLPLQFWDFLVLDFDGFAGPSGTHRMINPRMFSQEMRYSVIIYTYLYRFIPWLLYYIIYFLCVHIYIYIISTVPCIYVYFFKTMVSHRDCIIARKMRAETWSPWKIGAPLQAEKLFKELELRQGAKEWIF